MRHGLLPVFQRLAAVAMLALVLVPTLGRMGQGLSAPVANARVDASAHAGHHGAHGGHATASEAPAPRHGTSGDCDYCPLLQGLLTPGVEPIRSRVALVPAAPLFQRIDARIDAPHPTGLGSRGPPIA